MSVLHSAASGQTAPGQRHRGAMVEVGPDVLHGDTSAGLGFFPAIPLEFRPAKRQHAHDARLVDEYRLGVNGFSVDGIYGLDKVETAC